MKWFFSMNLSKRVIIIILLTLLLIALVYVLTGLNNALTVTEYELKSGKISEDIKLVLLTDTHNCENGEEQKDLIDSINAQNPDAVLLAGDIADDVLPDERTIQLLKGISEKYPCFYVTGNHEFWSENVDNKKELFRANNVRVLEGEMETLKIRDQDIFIFGVDDPEIGEREFQSQLDKVGRLATSEGFNILLSHRPERFESYVAFNFDVVVSGHAHGGQWRIPKILPNGLIAPNQGLFPKYASGTFEKNGTTMLVSRGLARESTPIIPRLHNPPEVVVITIKAE